MLLLLAEISVLSRYTPFSTDWSQIFKWWFAEKHVHVFKVMTKLAKQASRYNVEPCDFQGFQFGLVLVFQTSFSSINKPNLS